MKNRNFNQSTIKIEDIKVEVDKLTKVSELPENKGLFIVKSANEWIEEAKKRPTPKMLCGELWFEGEFCVLFASSNLGKSILAVQIANSISKGESTLCFSSEIVKQSVLYFDFELSEKQFEKRYSEEYVNHYQFDSSFTRIQMNPNSEIPSEMDYETFLYQSLEEAVIGSATKILIIDNLTYMKSGIETAKEALPLMKTLKALKAKHKVVSERYNKTTRKQEVPTIRYYISSLETDPDRFNSLIRSHWGIENNLHWMLDVTMGEDASRKRAKNSPQNFSVVFKTALTMLKRYKPYKGKPSIKTKRKMGGWSDEHLIAMMGMDPKVVVPATNKEASSLELKRCNEQTAMFKRVKQYLNELEHQLNGCFHYLFYFFIREPSAFRAYSCRHIIGKGILSNQPFVNGSFDNPAER